jgi:predicted type IV restriction endonuclease
LVLNLYLFFEINDVKIVYLKEKPEKIENLTFFRVEGRDFLESPESIIKKMEIQLIDYAKEKQADEIEIFILEKSKLEIPTESQVGHIGYVSILFSLKN